MNIGDKEVIERKLTEGGDGELLWRKRRKGRMGCEEERKRERRIRKRKEGKEEIREEKREMKKYT